MGVCMYLHMLLSHVCQPRKAKIWRILITLCNAIHKIQQHLWVFLKFLHLHCVREYHVQIEYKIFHLAEKIIQMRCIFF